MQHHNSHGTLSFGEDSLQPFAVFSCVRGGRHPFGCDFLETKTKSSGAQRPARKVKQMKKQVLWFGMVLLALCAATSTSLAQQGTVRLSVPGDGPFPAYARIDHTQIYHDDTWAAIVFYCNPEDVPIVPEPFNLLDFFDFRIMTGEVQVPMTVSGFLLLDSEAMAPTQSNLHGNGAVSVWFVSWPELQGAINDDGKLTVPELKMLPSLMKGTAAVYIEELHPSLHITINAQGRFDGGGRFQFHATGTRAGLQVIRIRIW